MQRLAGRALALLACGRLLQLHLQATATTQLLPSHLLSAITASADSLPVHRARKFSAVFGTTSLRSCKQHREL